MNIGCYYDLQLTQEGDALGILFGCSFPVSDWSSSYNCIFFFIDHQDLSVYSLKLNYSKLECLFLHLEIVNITFKKVIGEVKLT
ncbi:hypothetical protein ACF0H5_003328 [Mactra antiquata]